MVFSVVLITLVLVADGYGGFDGLGEGDGGGVYTTMPFFLPSIYTHGRYTSYRLVDTTLAVIPTPVTMVTH